MSINVYNIEQAILDKMNSSSTELELLEYSKMLEQIKTGIVQVADTFASLPAYADSVGHMYYVTDEETIYWANATNGWIALNVQALNDLYSWGYMMYGERATGYNYQQHCSPVQEITSSNTWTKLATNNQEGAGIKNNGTMWIWGRNINKQAGDGYSNIPFSSPVQETTSGTDWCSVSISYTGIGGIKTNGTLWMWGQGFCGPNGINNTVNTSSPTQEITSSTNWTCVNTYNTTLGLKSDGTLWGWGKNDIGQAMRNNTLGYSSPVQEITSSTNWCHVNSGYYVVHAIKTDGTLWGAGAGGRFLGDGANINRSSPVQEASSSANWCTQSGSSAIKTDGTLWGWGGNRCGEMGIGVCSTTCYSSPVQEITSSTNWNAVSGFNGTIQETKLAIKTDGTLWGWGDNFYGQAGCNVASNKISSPVQHFCSFTDWLLVRHTQYGTLGFRTITL